MAIITKKRLFTGLKFLVSIVLVYFIFSKLDLHQIAIILIKANPLYLISAFLFFVFSKFAASIRLNLYFHNISLFLSHKSNFKLYHLGMFYNLFLPGGIGGDGYKVWLLKKEFGIKSKKLISIMLNDRLSGMLLIYCISAFISLFIENEIFNSFKYLILLSIPLAIFSFWLLNKFVFMSGFKVIWKSISLSFFVQITQLVSVIFILKSLSIELNFMEYIFIFFVSSIVSVLPISIGGVGLREVTFFYGAYYFLLDENVSIGVSIIFFVIQALFSLGGIYFHFKKIKLITDSIHEQDNAY